MIVPCLDAEPTLPQCLDAVRANDYPPDRVELILADNGSRDRSPALARERGATVLSHPGASIGALRNAGAATARGDVLAFLDADCVPRPHWLREGVRALGQSPGVVGYPYDAPDDASWVERAWFAQREPGRREVAGLSGGNLLVPRELFQRIGGFDEALRTGEDAEFCTRARRHGTVVADDRVNVVHLGNPRTAGQFLRREIWYGLGALGTLRTQPFDRPFLGTLVFITASALQVAGVAQLVIGQPPRLLALGTALVLLLLAATLFHRRRFLRGPGHALQLGALYWLYYLGRSVSLGVLATGSRFDHRGRRTP